MINGVVNLVGPLVVANDFHELLGRWRELKAKTGWVAPSHHGGTRRCTGGIARITGFKIGALLRQTVDKGGGHSALGQATAIQANVVVAQVIGHDQNDVRWFAALTGFRACCFARLHGPCHLPVGFMLHP